MRVWLINPYGPIPGEGWREYRYAVMGRMLAAAGHEVVWWTSSFAHHFKRQRSVNWADVQGGRRFVVRLVPTPSYSRNISLERVYFEIIFAVRCFSRARLEPPPDVIVTVDPPQVASLVAERLSALSGARLIVDVVDLWPELFVAMAPKALRPFVRLFSYPLVSLRKRNLCVADGVIAVNSTYARIAVEAAPKHAGSAKEVFIGIDVTSTEQELAVARQGNDYPVFPPDRVWAIYAGSLGENYDIRTIFGAAEILEGVNRSLGIAIAGDGPLREFAAHEAAKRSNVIFLGSMPVNELAKAYVSSAVALSTYAPLSTVALPVKLYDYLTAGLPIVNSLRGEMADLLKREQVGVQYEAGDASSLAAALNSLVADGSQMHLMSANARKLAKSFDIHKQYSAFVRLCESVVGGNASAAAGALNEG